MECRLRAGLARLLDDEESAQVLLLWPESHSAPGAFFHPSRARTAEICCHDTGASEQRRAPNAAGPALSVLLQPVVDAPSAPATALLPALADLLVCPAARRPLAGCPLAARESTPPRD